MSDGLFETGSATDVGLVRAQNEDNFIARPEIGLWAVADGMGGHSAGDVASGMVVEALGGLPPPANAAALLQSCKQSMSEVNGRILATARERGLTVIGTTVVILLVADRHYACLWAGDSRIYRVRHGLAERITRDHSEAQELIDRGILTPEEAKSWGGRNVITRAIGVFEAVELDFAHGEVEDGDAFVLCSDGLTAHVEDGEIPFIVSHTKATAACDSLVRLTLERGAQDNVTVVVVRYKPQGNTIVLPNGVGAAGQGQS